MNTRRKFLQNLTASALALPLLSKQEYFENSNRANKIPYNGPLLRVAIMGLGSYGTRVADAMKDCSDEGLCESKTCWCDQRHSIEDRVMAGQI